MGLWNLDYRECVVVKCIRVNAYFLTFPCRKFFSGVSLDKQRISTSTADIGWFSNQLILLNEYELQAKIDYLFLPLQLTSKRTKLRGLVCIVYIKDFNSRTHVAGNID